MPAANEHECLIRKLRSQCLLCLLSDSDFRALSYPKQAEWTEVVSNSQAVYWKKCRTE